MPAIKRLEFGHFLLAGRAPCRPQVDEDYLPAIINQGDWLAGRVGQRQLRGRVIHFDGDSRQVRLDRQVMQDEIGGGGDQDPSQSQEDERQIRTFCGEEGCRDVIRLYGRLNIDKVYPAKNA
jgi:hypothetical protein